MKTYWKEKYIGKVLGGFLEDKNISIYKTDYIVVWDKNGIYEYINKNSIIEYNNINSSSKTKLGKAIVGDMLFGVAGTLSMGKEDEYLIEVKWINGKQSIISITGTTFYQFFISKLYENGTSILSNQMKIETENNLKKLEVDNKNKLKEELEELEKEYNFNQENINYFKIDNKNYCSHLEHFLELLPFYKAEYENNYNIISICENNIKKYNTLCRSYDVKENIKKIYKTTKNKISTCFMIETEKEHLSDSLTDIEKINELKKEYKEPSYEESKRILKNLGVKEDKIDDMIMKKREFVPIKDRYTDDELIMMLSKTEKENINYFNKKFINNELYNYLNDLHKKNGYIYVSSNKESQKTQVEIYKNKIPKKLYNLLNQIIEKSITKYDFDFVEVDLISIKPDVINEKIIAPSHFLISYFLNCYFGKNEENIETKTINNNSKYDEIRKIKELLDIGAITQEEFEIEKNKLLSN